MDQNKIKELFHENSILMCYRGSIAHNMYIPNDDPNSIDDIDLLGVFMAPVDYYIGLGRYKDAADSFIDEYDIINYEFKKMMWMLLKSNPNVLPTLNLKKEHYIYLSEGVKKLLDNKEIFYSLKAYKTFTGYAKGQLNKMEKYSTLGYMGKKRKELVEKFSFDTKNAAHCIRLLRMGSEFLDTGELNVYRTKDRDELLDIKKGKYSLKDIKEEAEFLFQRTKIAYSKSELPETPNYLKANELTQEIIYNYISQGKL